MSVRLQARKASLARFLMSPAGKALLILAVCAFTVSVMTFTFYYVKYARMIEEKLSAGPFANTSMLFAAPQVVAVGDEIGAAEIISQLRRSGYGESRTNRMGWYHVRPDAVEIFPGPDSYFEQEAGVIKFAGPRVAEIISLRDNTGRTQYFLEPELITNLFDRDRQKRRLIQFNDIPKVVVTAIISAEDKRFFQHAGFDPIRVIKAAYVDLKKGRIEEGASTLSMQLAGSLWLDRNKRTWSRKAAEVMMTLHLEQKLTKEEIFEGYANQIYLGRVGSFNIHGLGEGAQTYFGKDIRELTLPQAALLAGIIQRPSAFNPFRNPERAKRRRNLVLSLMHENGSITDAEYADALKAPLGVAAGSGETTDAPYFVDLVNERLQERFQDHDFLASSYRVYTTLDMNLQREAAEAVRIGLREVDEQLQRRGRTRAKGWPDAQVALVALDPQTGEVKALIGGRDYGASQLNRVLARRQPGSVFKPFVYAAALNTALEGSARPLTTISTIVDEPTTFWFDDKPYEPNNYKSEFHGTVTLRQAISKSMNIPTVKIAEAVGYEQVASLAREAGLNLNIQPTPAIALGAYEVTPIEIAGAYTVFARQGVHSKPLWIKMIRDEKGKLIHESRPEQKPVLDPRVAYLMTDLMQEVLRSGTGAGVRSRGFALPAAGKTGTSHDGWFAGFTSKLVCVVWVGYDDNRELKLEGARSALPIWTEFMKRAHQYREYRNATPFDAPDGIVAVDVDPASGKLAAGNCASEAKTEVFIAGTQPVELCGGGSTTHIAGWEPEAGALPEVASASPPEPPGRSARGSIAVRQKAANQAPEAPRQESEQKEKKNVFRRIWDIFK